MKQHAKAPDTQHRDSVPFIRSSSAVEIFESLGNGKANRENQPPRSRNQDSKQHIKLDAFFGEHESQSTVLREKEGSLQGPSLSSNADKRRHQNSREILAPTPVGQMGHFGSQHTLNSAEDENQRVMMKLMRQTRNQIWQRQQELDNRCRNQISSLKTLFTEVRRQLEDVDKRTSQQAKKAADTCSSMKLEYRNAFMRLVEQVNSKFVNNDKLFVELREQSAISRNSVELLKEELDKKMKQLQTEQVDLLTRLNNNIRVDELSNSQFIAELQSEDEHPVIQRDQSHSAQPDLQERVNELAAEIQKMKSENCKVSTLIQSINMVKPVDVNDQFELFNSEILIKLAKRAEQSVHREMEPKFEDYSRKIKQLSEQVGILESTIHARTSIDSKKRQSNLSEKFTEISMETETESLSPDQIASFQELLQFKSDIEEKLKNSRLLYTRKSLGREKTATEGMSQLSQTYFLDEEQYLMDGHGEYLIDDNNQRVKVQPDQLFFLSLHGLKVGELPSS